MITSMVTWLPSIRFAQEQLLTSQNVGIFGYEVCPNNNNNNYYYSFINNGSTGFRNVNLWINELNVIVLI